MIVEQAITTLLSPLVDGRVTPDTTPEDAQFPCIVHQVVGGTAHEYLERKLPDYENYRVQIACWSSTRDEARILALAVRQKIIEEGTQFSSAKTLGQAINHYQEQMGLYGTMQDFSITIRQR